MKLPDVNLLVAMSLASHAHHTAALAWRKQHPQFVTCPITELGLVRVLMQLGADSADAFRALEEVIRRNRSQLLPCDLSASVIAAKVQGHRQTTDAYLLALARHHRATLCTLDQGIKGAEFAG